MIFYAVEYYDSALAFFPGLSTVQFLITYSMHKQSIYHVKGIMSTSVGRVRRKEGEGAGGRCPELKAFPSPDQ